MERRIDLSKASNVVTVTVDQQVGTGTVQVGDDIPDGKTRYIWDIEVASTAPSTPARVKIYLGDASQASREHKLTVVAPQGSNGPHKVRDNPDPTVVLLPLTPDRDSSGNLISNQVRAAYEGAQALLTIRYYDE